MDREVAQIFRNYTISKMAPAARMNTLSKQLQLVKSDIFGCFKKTNILISDMKIV